MSKICVVVLLCGLAFSCSQSQGEPSEPTLRPKLVTEQVPNDSDDPAIWVHPTDPSKSIILGTDKHETEGGLYAFSLDGQLIEDRKVYPLERPNNVDIAYGIEVAGEQVDVAVSTERGRGMIRVFILPQLDAIDGGGIPVFEDDPGNNLAMGVALYKRPSDEQLFAIVSRKASGDPDKYLYQYALQSDDTGRVRGELVRKFGKFSGTKEIEAIAVDHALGYVYYSDEQFGIRKYYVDPDNGDEELAVFGLEGFVDDREGISIYDRGEGEGYIIVSDQGANAFRVFPREGISNNPHDHPLLAVLPVQAVSSDGSEVVATNLGPEFPKGLFVAMSDNRTFEFYDWRTFESYLK